MPLVCCSSIVCHGIYCELFIVVNDGFDSEYFRLLEEIYEQFCSFLHNYVKAYNYALLQDTHE